MVSERYKKYRKNIGITDMRKGGERQANCMPWGGGGWMSGLLIWGRNPSGLFFFFGGLKWYWHNVIAVQCSECQSGERFKTNADKWQEWPRQCDFRSDTDVQIVRYVPPSLFPLGTANDWRNRQHVVLDLFSNWKCVRSSAYFWWTSEARDNPSWANFGELCCVVLCVVSCVLLCVVVVPWRCGVSRWKLPPCVRSKCLRVYRYHAHMYKNMCAWCRYTRGRFEQKHGEGSFQRDTPQHTTHNTQHTTHNTQHTTHNTQHTTHNTQHTTHNTQHTTHNTQHTTHNTQHTTHNTQQQPQQDTETERQDEREDERRETREKMKGERRERRWKARDEREDERREGRQDERREKMEDERQDKMKDKRRQEPMVQMTTPQVALNCLIN